MPLFNKKAEGTQHTLFEIGLLLLAGILLVTVIVPAFVKLMPELRAGSAEKTLQNFIFLGDTINGVLNQEEPFYSTITDISIDGDHIIVGFDKGPVFQTKTIDIYESVFDTSGNEVAYKSALCGEDACICLYKDLGPKSFSKSEKVNDPLKCITFDGVSSIYTFRSYSDNFADANSVYFYKNYPKYYANMRGEKRKGILMPSVPKEAMYSYFVLYGECDGWAFDASLGMARLYVEKAAGYDKKTYLFIAPYVPDADHSLDIRLALLKKELKSQP